MKNILIVDDHPLTRMGIETLILKTIDPCMTYTAGTFEETVNALHKHFMDLIVLDLSIPGSRGLDMIDQLRREQKDVKVLICTGRDELANAPAYIQMGANGFLHKNAPHEEFEKALKLVLEGKKYLTKEVQQKILDNFASNTASPDYPIELLTPRERQILDQLILGKWTKEIARELDLKFSTVSTHKAKILEKMKVKNVVELYKKVDRFVNEL